MKTGKATLPRCTGRCTRMPQPFRPSALVESILVCQYCGAQQRREPEPKDTVSAQPVLYTVGYAGVRLEQVIRLLVGRQIQVLVDCRWSAWSQHPGFEAATLRRAVQGRGIAYRHLAELGSAPNLRRQLREEGDFDAFAAAYLSALVRQEELLGRVAGYAQRHRLCLLCQERDPDHCHRSLLATRLAELAGLTVEHLSLW